MVSDRNGLLLECPSRSLQGVHACCYEHLHVAIGMSLTMVLSIVLCDV